ncbi:hypothetical protein [Catenulispora rubra]|uniref:hypothetical protein n=1 Tax=Catenulispora rubra TaxID=280293 RepID=UPI0018926DF8|nr:hypothetical protein [Catenulispora rubra]
MSAPVVPETSPAPPIGWASAPIPAQGPSTPPAEAAEAGAAQPAVSQPPVSEPAMSQPAVSQPMVSEPVAAPVTGGPKHAGPKAQDGSPAATPWGKAAGAAETPWAKRRGPVKPHATARLRKTIEGLPDWEPLPPGEVFVQRGRGDG